MESSNSDLKPMKQRDPRFCQPVASRKWQPGPYPTSFSRLEAFFAPLIALVTRKLTCGLLADNLPTAPSLPTDLLLATFDVKAHGNWGNIKQIS
jgi:hypothetical protein